MSKSWQEQSSWEDTVEALLLKDTRTEDEEKLLETLLQEA